MLGTTTKLAVLFHVLRSWLHLKEIFFLGLGLPVIEINRKKVQKQKNKKNIRDVGMACHKICKQARNDIKAKVNTPSPIPTSFQFSHYSCALV